MSNQVVKIWDDEDSYLQIEDYLDLACNVYIKDTNGVYRECNSSQVKSFGADCVDDVVGKTDYELHPHKKECDMWGMNDLEVIKSEKPKVFIEPATYVNHPTFNMLCYKVPCRNKQGKVIGVFGTSIALNESHQLASLFPFANKELIANIKQDNSDSMPKISKRERECLDCLVRGMTAKEIARVLNLSPRTIEFYIENMKKKLGCSNRIKLIAKAYDILK